MQRLVAVFGAALGVLSAVMWCGCASQAGGGNHEGAGVEGWVYASAARSRAVTEGSNFTLSSVSDPSIGSVPTGTTTVSLGGDYQTTLDANGHYAISNVTPGVYDLQVVQETPGGLFFSDVFESIVVVPGQVTAGGVVPPGYAVRIDDPASTALDSGATLTLSARLIETPGGDVVTGFAGPFAWSSSNPSVVTVSAQGVATGRRAGSAVVTASAGSLSDSVTLSVTGGSIADTVAVSLALQTAADGADTRVTAFSVSVAQGSVTVPAGSLVLVTSPNGTLAGQATPETTGTTIELPDPVTVTGVGTMLITIRAPSGAAVEFDDGVATVARVEQLQLRCAVIAAGQTLFPPGVTLSIPGDGSAASSAEAAFTGVPSTAAVSVALEPGGTVSGVPNAAGALTLSGFDETVVSTLQAVRVSISAGS